MDDPAFLESIIANPEDDSPRLVYADWLDEHGESDRAEFIRVQCELARRAKFDPVRLPLLHREEELLEKHGAEWAKPVAAITREFEFHRGFVDTVTIGCRKLLTHGEKLFRLAPVRNVRIIRLGMPNATLNDLANCSVLPQIRGLALRADDSNALQALLTAPGLKNLTSLTLEDYFPPTALEPVLSGCLPRLEKLDVSGEDSALNTMHVETLAQARWASSLKHLNLKHHSINVGGVEAIAASKHLKNLSYLNLNGCNAGLGGTQALAESSTLSNLTTLDLRRNRLSDNAARALAASTKLPALTELYLGMNNLGPDGAKALANWPGLARLRSLHLYSNPIGDEGVCALAASPLIASLTRLDLTLTEIGNRGTRALKQSPYLKNVWVGSFKGDEKNEFVPG